eukprot:COSAG04_NODE_3982_length_2382_cov_1.501095_3_plen_197_part_00
MRRRSVLRRVAAHVAAATPEPEGTKIPPPLHGVRLEKSVMVPLRDGVRLSTDLYFPELPEAGTAELPLPVCLMRTPYNKNTERGEGRDGRPNETHIFAGAGFIVAVQDCRGKHESEGLYIDTLSREGVDGCKAVNLSRLTALAVSLTWKASPLQTTPWAGWRRSPGATATSGPSGAATRARCSICRRRSATRSSSA